MRPILLLCLLLISHTALHAQRYSFVRDMNDDVLKVIPAGESNFYSIGIHPGCGENYFTVRYHNRRGEIIRAFNSPRYAYGLLNFKGVTDPANNLYFIVQASNNHMIVKVDTAGNSAWTKIFSPGYHCYLTDINYAGGNLYLTGYASAGPSDSVRGVLTQMSPAGDILWSKIIKNADTRELFINDCKVYDGQLWLGGWYGSSFGSGSSAKPYLAKADLNGNILSTQQYTIDSIPWFQKRYTISEFERSDAGNTYALLKEELTATAIMKVGADMTPQWVKRVGADFVVFTTAWKQDSVILCGENYYHNTITYLNSSGAVAGQTATPGYDRMYENVTNIEKWDGGYLVGNGQHYDAKRIYAHILAGGTYCADTTIAPSLAFYAPPSNISSHPVSLITYSKTLTASPLGSVVYDTIVPVSSMICEQVQSSGPTAVAGVSSVSTETTLYPQPVTNRLHISQGTSPLQGTVSIHTADGRLSLQATNSAAGIDVSSLPPGLYFLRHEHYSARFLKQ